MFLAKGEFGTNIISSFVSQKKYIHYKTCAVPGCFTKGGRMFVFPTNPALRENWKKCCKIIRPLKKFTYACKRHFKLHDFNITDSSFRLKSGTLPSEHLPESEVPQYTSSIHCAVSGCSKQFSDGVTLHSFPRGTDRLSEWGTLCGVKDATRHKIICSDHFQDTDFRTGSDSLRKCLKRNSFPSRNLPEVDCVEQDRSVRDSADNILCIGLQAHTLKSEQSAETESEEASHSKVNFEESDVIKTEDFLPCEFEPADFHGQIDEFLLKIEQAVKELRDLVCVNGFIVNNISETTTNFLKNILSMSDGKEHEKSNNVCQFKSDIPILLTAGSQTDHSFMCSQGTQS